MKTYDQVKAILHAEQDLNANGFRCNGLSYKVDHDASRAEMTCADSLKQFERALEFLQQCVHGKSVWKGATSYTWKHLAERLRNDSGYNISNGIFIAAAIHLGFTIKRIPNSPNCFLNISKESIPEDTY